MQTAPEPGSPGPVRERLGSRIYVSSSRCHLTPPHGAPAVLTWRHGSTPSLTPPTARYRPTQTVGRGLRGDSCSNGGFMSGLVRSTKRRTSGRHQRDPTKADALATGTGAGPSGPASASTTRRAVGPGSPARREAGRHEPRSGSRCLHHGLPSDARATQEVIQG
jgi:hypothetical protein